MRQPLVRPLNYGRRQQSSDSLDAWKEPDAQTASAHLTMTCSVDGTVRAYRITVVERDGLQGLLSTGNAAHPIANLIHYFSPERAGGRLRRHSSDIEPCRFSSESSAAMSGSCDGVIRLT